MPPSLPIYKKEIPPICENQLAFPRFYFLSTLYALYSPLNLFTRYMWLLIYPIAALANLHGLPRPIRVRLQGFHPCWIHFTCYCSSLVYYCRSCNSLSIIGRPFTCCSPLRHVTMFLRQHFQPYVASSYFLDSVLYLHGNPLILLPFTSDVGYLVRMLMVID